MSYEQLLRIFWDSHNPYQRGWSTQYKNALFYHNDEQKRLAEASLQRLQDRGERSVRTELIPASEFYPAEDYHQKYYLRRHSGLMREFAHLSDEEFMRSTAAARVNGLVAGYGDTGFLDRLDFEFSPDFRKKLEGLHTRTLGLVDG